MSASKERSAVNSSTSKAMFAFSKDNRFKAAKKEATNAFGYEIPGSFGWKRDGASGRGFGSSQKDRFGYEAFRKTKRDEGRLDGRPEADTKRRTASYSFGVSRS